MREFILYSKKGLTSPSFNLDDLPGSGGRMDLVARCVISALWMSRQMRRDSKIYLNLNGPPDPPLTLCFDGERLRKVSPDGRNVATWIQKVLKKRYTFDENEWNEVKNGIYLSNRSFQDLIKDRKDRKFYVLHEKGEDIREIGIEDNPVFVLGDHIGLPKTEKKFVKRFDMKKISLGSESYFSSQSITLVQNELDRRSQFSNNF
ncbi:MAG: tRNA (pseudouridine(54)-N(1))-methyltransferase TrmY [Candidatus Aenigmatarchaeota archaeon]